MLAVMPRGDLGTRYSLMMMRLIARGASQSPTIAKVAFDMVRFLPPTTAARIGAIRSYVRTYIHYQNDPHDVEHVQQPVRLVQEIAQKGSTVGDCDDVAVVAAALALAMGLQVQYVVEAFRPPPTTYAHVYAELLGLAGTWERIDTTKPRGMTPIVTRRAIYPV
jgi:transglutaminase-like putative cysteine protease